MQKTYWKIFAAGLVIGLAYFGIAYYSGISYIGGINFGGLFGIQSDITAVILNAFPLILWGGLLFYAYQASRGWKFLSSADSKSKCLTSIIFGLGVFIVDITWVILAVIFIYPSIG